MALRLAIFRLAAAVALTFAGIALMGNGARAFTINNESATNADGTARFADPDDEVNNFGRSGFLFGQGGPSVQFGPPGAAQGGANWPLAPLGPRSFSGGHND